MAAACECVVALSNPSGKGAGPEGRWRSVELMTLIAACSIIVWNEVDEAGSVTLEFNLNARVRPRVNSLNPVFVQWISVEIDLLTGLARAAQIDPGGNAIFDYGQLDGAWGTVSGDAGTSPDVIALASNSQLLFILSDDMHAASYAELRLPHCCWIRFWGAGPKMGADRHRPCF